MFVLLKFLALSLLSSLSRWSVVIMLPVLCFIAGDDNANTKGKPNDIIWSVCVCLSLSNVVLLTSEIKHHIWTCMQSWNTKTKAGCAAKSRMSTHFLICLDFLISLGTLFVLFSAFFLLGLYTKNGGLSSMFCFPATWYYRRI